MTENNMPARIPVTFFTGFLGSGKTTLISALLQQPDMVGTAVIVNEFGEIGLDNAIFSDTLGDDNVRLLANGCMCCVAGDDLTLTLRDLVKTDRQAPSRIFIETTGLADPVSLIQKIMTDLRLRPRFRLDGVVATIDAVNGARNLDEHEVSLRQVAVADLRIITKSDLTDPTSICKLSEKLGTLNPGAKTITVTNGDVVARDFFGMSLIDAKTGLADLERWLNVEAHGVAEYNEHHAPRFPEVYFSGGRMHGEGMGTWLIEESSPVDWDRLSPRIGAIVEKYGHLLLRLKGVVQTDSDDRPLVLHGVQHLFHAPVWLKKWPFPPKTAFVVIGGHGANIAIGELKAALNACVTITAAR